MARRDQPRRVHDGPGLSDEDLDRIQAGYGRMSDTERDAFWASSDTHRHDWALGELAGSGELADGPVTPA